MKYKRWLKFGTTDLAHVEDTDCDGAGNSCFITDSDNNEAYQDWILTNTPDEATLPDTN